MGTRKNEKSPEVSHGSAKVSTDGRGRSIWSSPVEDAELELLSTAELELALQAASEEQLKEITEVAHSGKPGVVVRNAETGAYGVISNAELRALKEKGMTGVPEGAVDSDGDDDLQELSLVSTQALKQMLMADDDDDSIEMEVDSGFNPYDRG